MRRFVQKYPVLSISFLILLCLAPIMALRDFTPSNELRYLSIADEALRDCNIFAFTNHGLAYADKPPLYFWIIMLCRLIFGKHSMFVLSLFSMIPALVIINVMDKWLCESLKEGFSCSERIASALLLGTSGLFLGMSVFLRMDMLMCMWIVLAIYAFYKDKPAMFALYTFLALFTKGPVGILAPLVSVLVYLIVNKQYKQLGRWFGWKTWAIIGGGCIVWFTGVFLDGGTEYLNNLLFHQTLGRAVNSFHHSRPFWYYLILIWEVMAPWCLLTVTTVVAALCAKGKGKTGLLWTCIIASSFVMLSCFSSKIAIYLAPLFPFMAYLFPLYVKRNGYRKWHKIMLTISSCLFLVIGLTVITAVALFNNLSGILKGSGVDVSSYIAARSPLTLMAGLVLVLGSIMGLRSVKVSWDKALIPPSISLLVSVSILSWLVPSFNDLIGYRNLCNDIPENLQVYTYRCHRPENMDVYLGHEITILEKEDYPDAQSALEIVPENAVLVSKAKYFPDGIDSRVSIKHGDYTIYLPKGDF